MISPEQDNRLRELLALHSGWLDEGEGEGEAVRPACVDMARKILDKIQIVEATSRRPGIFPTPEGGVQIEWNRTHSSVTLLVPPDEPAEVRVLLEGVFDTAGEGYASVCCPVPGTGDDTVLALADAARGFIGLTQSVAAAQKILLAR